MTGKHKQVIPNWLRYALLEGADFKCQCCGRKAPSVELEIDHHPPLKYGGGHEVIKGRDGRALVYGLQVLCKDCNRGKGNFYEMPDPNEGLYKPEENLPGFFL